MIKNTTTLGDLTVSELIKTANSLKKAIKIPALSEAAKQTLNDYLYCTQEVLKLKQAA